MWPWLLILAGTLLIVGALIARRRILSDHHAGLARTSRATITEDVAEDSSEDVPGPDVVDEPPPDPPEVPSPAAQIRTVPADEVPIFVVTASDPSTRPVAETAPTERLGPERPAPRPVLPPRPAFARATNPPPPAATPDPVAALLRPRRCLVRGRPEPHRPDHRQRGAPAVVRRHGRTARRCGVTS